MLLILSSGWQSRSAPNVDAPLNLSPVNKTTALELYVHTGDVGLKKTVTIPAIMCNTKHEHIVVIPPLDIRLFVSAPFTYNVPWTTNERVKVLHSYGSTS